MQTGEVVIKDEVGDVLNVTTIVSLPVQLPLVTSTQYVSELVTSIV